MTVQCDRLKHQFHCVIKSILLYYFPLILLSRLRDQNDEQTHLVEQIPENQVDEGVLFQGFVNHEPIQE